MKMRINKVLTLWTLISTFIISCEQQGGDIIIADFESDTYDNWNVEGSTFGTGPSRSVESDRLLVKGYQGEGFVNSSGSGDSTGRLISPPFTIDRNYINFLAGGMLEAGECGINLLVDNHIVRTYPGPDDWNAPSMNLEWASWDASDLKGKQAVIEIVDRQPGRRGVALVDQIYQSNKNRVTDLYDLNARRRFPIEDQFLNVPIKEGTRLQRMCIFLGDQMIREFEVELAEAEPDYWMFLDVGKWKGKEVTIQIEKIAKDSKGLNSIFVDNKVRGFDSLYSEKYRPQLHYTPKRGWHNDPNGLLFYKGDYHLFYQHNPLGWPWGNMTWGHAISNDLVHWKEQVPALWPDELGTMFSGSGVVDWNNTTGFQNGDEKPLVLIYTAAGGTSSESKDKPFTQCLAYSTDKGVSWIKYEGNPVLGEIVRYNRDPKVAWYAPDKKWIMALFLEGNTFALFTSRDMKSWDKIQEIEIKDGAECPDFFEIPLDGNKRNKKWVLTAANGRFRMGSFDGKQFTPETESYPSEWGENYYAVQSYSDIQDGRRIQFGWMNGSDFKGMPFNQQFSLPRELTLRTTKEGIRLYGSPVKEIDKLHGKKMTWSNVDIRPDNELLSELKGDLYHLISEFRVDKNSSREFGFNVRGFELTYNIQNNIMRVHRPTDGKVTEVKLLPEDGKVRFELLLDKASVEIFANNGKVPMAFFYIPPANSKKISITCGEGNIQLSSLEVYELKSIWD
jgi:fructan beta-fructosidase